MYYKLRNHAASIDEDQRRYIFDAVIGCKYPGCKTLGLFAM
jgi:hypothetical protein